MMRPTITRCHVYNMVCVFCSYSLIWFSQETRCENCTLTYELTNNPIYYVKVPLCKVYK